VAACPSCWREVSLSDIFCPHCAAEFEDYRQLEPEIVKSEDKNGLSDLFRVISVVVIAFSIALLLIALALDWLHFWIQPISSNLGTYLMIALVGVLVAALAYEINKIVWREGKALSRNRKLSPYILLGASVVAFGLIIWADTLDTIFVAEGIFIEIILILTLVAGGLLYLQTSDYGTARKRLRS